MFPLAPLLAVLLVTGTPPPEPAPGQATTTTAPAAPTPVVSFNKHIAQALEARKRSDHAAAIVALDAAIAAIRTSSGASFDKARSRAFFYKATSLSELGRYNSALTLLNLLRSSPGLSIQERLVVKRRLSQARRLLAIEQANQPGDLTVSALNEAGEPMTDAAISVDGKPSPPPPFSVKLAPGRHLLRLFRNGELVDIQRINVTAGEGTRLVMRPAPLPAWKPPAGGWAFIGSGIALGVVGGVLQAFAAADYTTASDKNVIWRKANELAERGDQLTTAAYASYGVAGAMVLIGGIWMLVDGTNYHPVVQLKPESNNEVTIGMGGTF